VRDHSSFGFHTNRAVFPGCAASLFCSHSNSTSGGTFSTFAKRKDKAVP
jgi:hypothetical protein